MHFIRYIIQAIFLWITFRIVGILFADFRVRGLSNLKGLDTRRGVIFASNHASRIDAVLVPLALPFLSRLLPMYYVSLGRQHYQRFPLGKFLYGWPLFPLLGAFPAPKGLRDYSKSLAAHEQLLKEGRSLCIFPEGQVNDDYQLTDALNSVKGGVGFLAEATGAVIVPVLINGIYRLRFWDFIFFKNRFRVTFGKPTKFPEIYSEIASGISVAPRSPVPGFAAGAAPLDLLDLPVEPEANSAPAVSSPAIRTLVVGPGDRYKLVAKNIMARIISLKHR